MKSRYLIAIVALVLLLSLTACPAGVPPEGDTEALAPGPQLENGSFTAELDGFPIHYEVHGLGSVLMVLPNSWGLSLEGLRAVFHPLEQHLTLVYFDPRGMGESGPIREDSDMSMAAVREDFDALRRHLELDRVHAMGWSNGAVNLILLASEKPEILRSAIFVHATPRFTEEDAAEFQKEHPELVESWAALQRELADDTVSDEKKEADLRRLDLEVWFPTMFADVEAGRKELPELFRDTQLSWRHSLYAEKELPTYDFTDRLAKITVPSLVIAGAHDLLPPDRVEELHFGIPDSRFVVFENSGHFAMVEEPEKWQKVVLDFITEVERDEREKEERELAGEETE
jgi:pimeloyl-ACP methyl ester carboxylesterase